MTFVRGCHKELNSAADSKAAAAASLVRSSGNREHLSSGSRVTNFKTCLKGPI